jgi:hypothetical protein
MESINNNLLPKQSEQFIQKINTEYNDKFVILPFKEAKKSRFVGNKLKMDLGNKLKMDLGNWGGEIGLC